MPVGRYKEEFLADSPPVPYSMLLEGLKTGVFLCQQKKKSYPDKYVLYFSPNDRRVRGKTEDFLLDELTRDVLYILENLNTKTAQKRVIIEFRTEPQFSYGRVRFEFFKNTEMLFRFEQEKNLQSEINYQANSKEWNAVDILPTDKTVDKSILVVDDEPVLCAVLGRMLSKLGYNAVCAHDGVEAVEIMAHMHFDLVVTDLRMPRMDGWSLMKYVKKDTPDIPVILITGYHSMHTRNRATQNSADGYISKPFSVDQIKTMLENVLETKANPNRVQTFAMK